MFGIGVSLCKVFLVGSHVNLKEQHSPGGVPWFTYEELGYTCHGLDEGAWQYSSLQPFPLEHFT